jgi:hypothetical protein
MEQFFALLSGIDTTINREIKGSFDIFDTNTTCMLYVPTGGCMHVRTVIDFRKIKLSYIIYGAIICATIWHRYYNKW